MKHLFTQTLLSGIVILASYTGGITVDITAKNFAVYNLNGQRSIFYQKIDSMPEDCLLIVNFTSIHCLPCKKEIPELKNITLNGKGKIKLMFIYAETADLAMPNAKLLGVIENAYVDPFGNIQNMYNVKKYPVTFIINKQYKVLGRFEGYNEKNIMTIRSLCGEKMN